MQASQRKKASKSSQLGRAVTAAPKVNKSKTQPKKKKAAGQGTAVFIRQPRIGMPDLVAHTVSWVCGSVYIGNGTLGATDSVYFADGLNGGYLSTNITPILGSDSRIGASYVKALEALYRRKRYRQIKLRFQAIQSATTNNMTLTAAPVRGPPGIDETGVGTNGTVAALTQQNVMSMSGSQTCDSFESMVLDLTPYIAGGAGSMQNEFAIADTNSGAVASIMSTPANLIGVSPCSFAVAGNSTVTTLRGTKTHLIVVDTVVDYLDFVAGVPVVDPIGFPLRKGT